MRKIITINRQFASGGHDVARKLAELLGIKVYDKELISQISDKTQLSQEFIAERSEKRTLGQYTISYANAFTYAVSSPMDTVQIAQTQIIKELAEQEDCIIVGRCANYILEHKAYKVFIYASDMDSRIDRCYKAKPEDREISRAKMEKQILSLDKQRAKYHAFYTDQDWHSMSNYNLCIDTSHFGIHNAAELIKHAVEAYFPEEDL